MAIQLTTEQEERILAAVNAGIYPSAKAALDAAIDSVHSAPSPALRERRKSCMSLFLTALIPVNQ